MSLSNLSSGQRTMFNPVSYYRKRVALKQQAFNPDKKTLNLQALNRFVNGNPKRPRTRPTYLLAKTRKLLGHTIQQDIDAGKFGEELKQVATNLVTWCTSPRAADNTQVRHWLKQLAEVDSVKVEAVEVEPVKIPTWTVPQLIKDFGGDEGTHVSSEDDSKSRVSSNDVAPSHRTSEEEYNWSAAFAEVLNGIEFAIPNDPNDVESGAEDVGGNSMGSATIDSNLFAENVSKRENVLKDGSNRLDNRGRRPLPLLRPKSDSTLPRNGVVHMVDEEVVPVKK